MTNPDAIAEAYIALWNEADPGARAARLEREWSADADYVDPMMKGQGRAAIGELIAGVHQQFPGFRFSLIAPAQGHNGFVRFSWALGPAAQEAPIGGTDVVQLVEGRIRQVVGFLDKVPTAAA